MNAHMTTQKTRITPSILTIFSGWSQIKPFERRTTYTYEQAIGSLADEMSTNATPTTTATAQTVAIEPEDFESAYGWFYS